MQQFEQHEQFEMEVLDNLNSGRYLDNLVFGGGTMLRLCHEMNRYSVDMDFYFKKELNTGGYFTKLKENLTGKYTITDANDKFNTLLIELRHSRYLSRLKIEINKKKRFSEYTSSIAFSPYSTRQVLVNTLTLEQMMINKIETLLDRKEIRDAFDIEFIIRRGIKFPANPENVKGVTSAVAAFKKKDYDVTLGSLLPPDIRGYYREHRFDFLLAHLKNL
tara:strand:+ start:1004 stop:1660 length:657 start_codon:yes stop_codon:yes gene_type:complete